jgi:hypothetical protein
MTSLRSSILSHATGRTLFRNMCDRDADWCAPRHDPCSTQRLVAGLITSLCIRNADRIKIADGDAEGCVIDRDCVGVLEGLACVEG